MHTHDYGRARDACTSCQSVIITLPCSWIVHDIQLPLAPPHGEHNDNGTQRQLLEPTGTMMATTDSLRYIFHIIYCSSLLTKYSVRRY